MSLSAFRAPWGLRGRHVQTLLSGLWRPSKVFAADECHLVEVSHGDRLVLHENRPASVSPRISNLLMIHGMGGCHGSGYMIRIARRLVEAGHRVFRIDLRGTGEGVRHARRPYHSGLTEDIAAAVEYLLLRQADRPLQIIAFSLGGNVVLKRLGEWGAATPPGLARALVVAPPIDLPLASANLRRGFNRVYDRFFARALFDHLQHRRSHFVDAPGEDLEAKGHPNRVRDYDEALVAPVWGFDDADHYYREASARPHVDGITLPTRILAARDDPLVPAAMLEGAAWSPSTEVTYTDRGGHMGFLTDLPSQAERPWWLDRYIVAWASAC